MQFLREQVKDSDVRYFDGTTYTEFDKWSNWKKVMILCKTQPPTWKASNCAKFKDFKKDSRIWQAPLEDLIPAEPGIYEWKCSVYARGAGWAPRKIVYYCGSSKNLNTKISSERNFNNAGMEAFFEDIRAEILTHKDLNVAFFVRYHCAPLNQIDIIESNLLAQFDYVANTDRNGDMRLHDSYQILFPRSLPTAQEFEEEEDEDNVKSGEAYTKVMDTAYAAIEMAEELPSEDRLTFFKFLKELVTEEVWEAYY